MEMLIAGSIGFVLVHLGVSGTPVRQGLIAATGEQAYLGIYSVLSLMSLGLMIYGYGEVSHADFVWQPTAMGYKLTKGLVLLAMLTLGCGLFAKNPTAVQNDKALEAELAGMMKITRHPIQWAILLFCIGHVNANGDVASLILFGSIGAVSFLGMFAMDARQRKKDDPRWQAFMESTSMFPFAAVLGGRVKLTLADVPWLGLLVGAVVYVAAYWFHGFLSGGMALV